MQKAILLYFIFVNFAAFTVYAFDKFRSRNRGSRRISEKELLAFSAIGGFLGATLCMALLKHKTNKSSFLIKHIVIMLIWIVVVAYYFLYFNELNFLR
ncbi:DUF1294 domain-containing protein [Sulfurimonas sp.]